MRVAAPCYQVLLDANRHVSLTDTPPEDERTEEPEAGTATQARAGVWSLATCRMLDAMLPGSAVADT